MILTTITCVTAERVLSPAISVQSSTPLVQNVNSVFGETLLKIHKDTSGFRTISMLLAFRYLLKIKGLKSCSPEVELDYNSLTKEFTHTACF